MKQLAVIIVSSLVLCSCCGRTGVRYQSNAKEEIITSSENLNVQTTSGIISGYLDRGVYTYKGVPYAQAERFMAPEPVRHWEGVRSCCAYGPVSPQAERRGWASDKQAFWFDWDDGHSGEDCLRLNIWSKGVGGSASRPVMVWLHGGGYEAGSSQELPAYDGWALADKGDVVLVSINHRLNVLGFLDLSAYGEHYAASGNAGMLDIVAALGWIHDNIARFGGNPDNVTIFGQSGGGGKVSTLMAMPSAKGLFHKAIVESGSMGRVMESKYSRRIGAVTIEELGIKPNELGKLQNVPYAQLLEAGGRAIKRVKTEVAAEEGTKPFIFGWGPTVDGQYIPSQPFVDGAPEQSADIPMIIGTTANEFLLMAYLKPNLRTPSIDSVRSELETIYGARTDDFIAAYAKAYPNYSSRDLFDVDIMFRMMAVAQADLKVAQNRGKVYMYLFNWESPVFNGEFRASHCIELPFVFNNVGRCRQMTGSTPEAYELADKVSSAWIAFARNGSPATEKLPEWVPYDSERRATMILGNDCKVLFGHDRDLLDLVAQINRK